MKKLTDREYEQYQEYLDAINHGRLLTPDGLNIVCVSFDYNPEKIGKHMLKMLTKYRNASSVVSAIKKNQAFRPVLLNSLKMSLID